VKGKSLFSGVSGRSRIPIEFHLEAGHLLYFYYESAMARDYFDTALKLSGLDIHLTGQTVANRYVLIYLFDDDRHTFVFNLCFSFQDILECCTFCLGSDSGIVKFNLMGIMTM